jgi:hypothetical protein
LYASAIATNEIILLLGHGANYTDKQNTGLISQSAIFDYSTKLMFFTCVIGKNSRKYVSDEPNGVTERRYPDKQRSIKIRLN